jgi:hypothetical protein
VHRLVLTNLDSTPVYLDYFIYDSVGPTLDAHVSDTPNQPGLGWTGPEVTQSPKKVSAGAIVGGVFGGIALALLLGALIYYYRRRRRQSIQFDHVSPTQTMRSTTGTGVTPFTPISASSPSPRHHRRPRKGEVVPAFASRPVDNGPLLHTEQLDGSEGSTITSTGYPLSTELSARDNFPSTSRRDRAQADVVPNLPRTTKQPFIPTGANLDLRRGTEGLIQHPRTSPSTNLDSSQPMSPPPAYHDLR